MENQLRILNRLRDQLNFLGYEFLTWLFVFTHNDEINRLDFSSNDEFKIFLGSKVSMCLLGNKEQKTTINSPLLEESKEAFLCIKNGLLVENLSLAINIDDTNITLQLHAHDFSFNQLKIKENFDNDLNDFSRDDSDNKLSERDQNHQDIMLRMATSDQVEGILNNIFNYFIDIRLSGKDYIILINHMRELVNNNLKQQLSDSNHVSVELTHEIAP